MTHFFLKKNILNWFIPEMSTNLFILVSCDANELRLLEHKGSEGRVGELQDVAGPHQVEPRLVLVHRVQDCLEIRN